MSNKKQTSQEVAHLASEVLKNPNSSAIQKTFAASALSQHNTGKSTGAQVEDLAAKALNSPKYSESTKTLAGSLMSQSVKER